jgi:dTDP-4-amino-4,6-dideoxy-D-galactose acyltransferase
MIRPLPWDSAHFEYRIGLVEGDQPETNGDFDCLYFLAPSGDEAIGERCRDAGFVAMGDRVGLLARDLTATPPAGMRAARPEDIEALAAIRFPDSRFSRDPHFAAERVAALYRIWIEKLLPSTFVAVSGGSVAGYLACAADEAHLRISLLGVAAEFRGGGVGASLLNQAKLYASQLALPELTVVTQGENESALRLYRRSGFREVTRQTWYHWWRS